MLLVDEDDGHLIHRWCNVVAFMFSGWFHVCSNCFFVVSKVDIFKSIFKYAHIAMIMMDHFLQFSDNVHWQVSTNMPVPLLGLLICISHEVHLTELWILLWKWKQSFNFCGRTDPES